jgi:hypothetical protein
MATITTAPCPHHQNIKRLPSQSLIFMTVSVTQVFILMYDNKMTPYFSDDLVGGGDCIDSGKYIIKKAVTI